MEKLKRFAVLCDFDGTVAKGDIGSTLFKTYAGGDEWEGLIEAWERGRIGSRDCLIQECRLAKVNREQIEALTRQFQIDDHFSEFARWCEGHGAPLVVVSDGLDFYIELFLGRHGLSRLPVHANHLVFVEGGIRPEFPYFEHGCGKCGNCKGYHVRRHREEYEEVIFVGDGYSDRCALGEADLVLAKTGLVRLCNLLDVPCVEITDFSDVIDALEKRIALGSKRSSPRRSQACHPTRPSQ
ncbi:MAG: MtnX-like HAD-IB family phosphatase [Candidatus Eisenbacteria bacterium]